MINMKKGIVGTKIICVFEVTRDVYLNGHPHRYKLDEIFSNTKKADDYIHKCLDYDNDSDLVKGEWEIK